MLHLENIIAQLDHYLNESGLYEADLNKSEEISAKILADWKDRFEQAVRSDFIELLQLDASCSNVFFELFGDQGATIWTMRVVVNDDKADPKLSFWVKSVINYRISKAFLEEVCIRQTNYNGSSLQARILYNKL